ncbi:MAG: SH3 domain-containing protein [Saprospiraceae bacterium]
MTKLNLSVLFFLLTIIFCGIACQGESTAKQNEATTQTNKSEMETTEADAKPDAYDAPAISPKKEKNNKVFYAWVDKLNIRAQPNLKSKTVATVTPNDALIFKGEKSTSTETIVLRAVAYDEAWLKVSTPDQQTGWVFGGAVKRVDEQKGNATITDLKFNFPKFGKFDLSNWKKLKTTDESGGDAEIIVSTYQKDQERLKITISDVSDYGYGRTYELLDSAGNLLKERKIHFDADIDTRILKETVKDYTLAVPKQFERSQKLKVHHAQLNGKPLIAQGEWKETNLRK